MEVEQNCDSWLCFGFGSFSSKNTNLNDFFCDRFPKQMEAIGTAYCSWKSQPSVDF